MTAATTSIDNHREHKRSGRLGDQEQVLLRFLAANMHSNYSRSELHKALGMPLGSVCGRINTLVKLELVKERPTRPCMVTGKTITPVRIARTDPVSH